MEVIKAGGDTEAVKGSMEKLFKRIERIDSPKLVVDPHSLVEALLHAVHENYIPTEPITLKDLSAKLKVWAGEQEKNHLASLAGKGAKDEGKESKGHGGKDERLTLVQNLKDRDFIEYLWDENELQLWKVRLYSFFVSSSTTTWLEGSNATSEFLLAQHT